MASSLEVGRLASWHLGSVLDIIYNHEKYGENTLQCVLTLATVNACIVAYLNDNRPI